MKTIEQGILVHRAPYSETSLLVTLLTREHGLATFLFQGGKKKKGNILFPLAQIEFSYYKRLDSSLGKISEVNLSVVSQHIPFDPVKSSIAFFMAELIHLLIKPGHPEKALFRQLEQEIRWLDASDELTNYPIWLFGLFSRECGIAPSVEAVHPTVFDLAGGKLSTVRPIHPQYVEGEWVHWLETALQEEKAVFLAMAIPREERLKCFDAWIAYFQNHLPGLRDFKSVPVIREYLS